MEDARHTFTYLFTLFLAVLIMMMKTGFGRRDPKIDATKLPTSASKGDTETH